ncbi:FtsX-like permease family protein [Micromonospora sp. WMMD812]|uniref:FtsX-like permease family protein n=1 Tax=Micromonospora sp. WMMD812 TaxID=3015152 RepID=UPI00248C1951|nr:FtsX-like permease family protein [Micromonospora sp. WMMD812]WBB70378.1 ABC transporter permease [Micromonospora sp. WMMD812]
MTVRPGVRFRLPAGVRPPSRGRRPTPAGAGGGASGGRRRTAELIGSWRAALRIARREARRARGRTALVLAMITLPVLVLTFLAASYDMAELTRGERIDRQLGSADAGLRWVGDLPIVQDEWGESWYPKGGDQPALGRPATTEEVTALLGPGARATEVRGWTPVDFRVDGRDAELPGRTLDLTDPLARSTVRLRAGRVPVGPGEIAASPAALRRLDARVGDTVTSARGARSYRVVGVVEFPDDLGPLITLHPTGAPPAEGAPDSNWLVDVPGTVDADLVHRLNERGVVVTTRTATGPGFGPRLGPDQGLPTSMNDLGTGVLVAGLGLLEVVLLVGPAFAVGVRRRRRDLALVAVAGADATQLRRVVLADGVVLGCLGAAAGLVLGVGAAFAARPLMEEYVFGARFGGYRCWPAALVVIAGVAVLAGVLAALAPAWTAARQDVVAGLAGRRTPPRHRGRWLVLGLALATGGAALAALGAARTAPIVILAGLILGELGLVFCTPTLIGLLARLGRALPLAPRIALRDASRNRASAAPAISAVMAAVAGSVALGTYLASDTARNAATYRPAMPPGHLLVTQRDPDGPPPSPGQVGAAARTHLDADAVAPVGTIGCDPDRGPTAICTVNPVRPPERVCPWVPSDVLSAADRRQARADPRCHLNARDPYGMYVEVLVDDGAALPILTGAPPADAAAAAAVLRAGGVVVTDPSYLRDGRVAVEVDRGAEGGPPVNTVSVLTGYALTGGIGPDRLLLSPAAATRLGLSWTTTGWAVAAPTPPDQRRLDRFTAALRPSGGYLVNVERGSPSSQEAPLLLLLAAGAGLITVGAAGIATGLAAAEGRADLSTLAAVGASPGVRRLLSLCQAGVIAGLGSVLGIVAGLGSAGIIIFSINRQYAGTWPVEDPYPLVVPWSALGVLVLVPLVAMLGAGLFTRSRLPIERRLD